MIRRYSKIIVAILSLMVIVSTVSSEVGVTENRILVGQSCALSGIASDVGQALNRGVNVYLDYINAHGGIRGRSIELIAYDDGYDPLRAAQATRKLVSIDSVFCLISEFGTPTSQAVLPLITQEKIPFLAPFSGAVQLREPFNEWVVHIRSSYRQEMEKICEHLIDHLGYKNIACFYQADAFGNTGLIDLREALADRGMELAAEGSYIRNSLAIQQGLATIREAKPEAVVLIGVYMPCAVFIKSALHTPELENAVFCGVSFVGATSFMNALGDMGNGCIVSEVVPFPWDTTLPVVAEYNHLMKEAGYGPGQIEFVSLEGFLTAKFFCRILERIEGEPTREKLIEAIEKPGGFDLGGFKLSFSPNDHQGSDEVFLIEFRDNKIVLLE